MISLSNTLICSGDGAFTLDPQDCDIWYFENAPHSIFCDVCDSVIIDSYVPKNLLISCSVVTFAGTYDNRVLVNETGRVFLERYSSTEIQFEQIDKANNWFSMIPMEAIAYDTGKMGVRFIKKCEKCGNFESIVGADPAIVKCSDQIDEFGVYHSDVGFGSGREKWPVILVGKKMKNKLSMSFPELDFRPVIRE